jgi:hypothetical protein
MVAMQFVNPYLPAQFSLKGFKKVFHSDQKNIFSSSILSIFALALKLFSRNGIYETSYDHLTIGVRKLLFCHKYDLNFMFYRKLFVKAFRECPLAYAEKMFHQGILTEEEGSVQLTSSKR